MECTRGKGDVRSKRWRQRHQKQDGDYPHMKCHFFSPAAILVISVVTERRDLIESCDDQWRTAY